MIRTGATWFGAVVLSSLTGIAAASLLNELIHPAAFTNYVAFWGCLTGLFGVPALLLVRRLWDR